MTIGIYAISTPQKRLYIGQSSNCEGRMQKHKRMAETQTHTNKKLGQAIREENCVFKILCAAELHELDELEAFAIDFFNADINIIQPSLGGFGGVEMRRRLQETRSKPEFKQAEKERRSTAAYLAKVQRNAKAMWEDPSIRAKIISARKATYSTLTPEQRLARVSHAIGAAVGVCSKPVIAVDGCSSWPSAAAAAKHLGVDISAVTNAIRRAGRVAGVMVRYTTPADIQHSKTFAHNAEAAGRRPDCKRAVEDSLSGCVWVSVSKAADELRVDRKTIRNAIKSKKLLQGRQLQYSSIAPTLVLP